MKAKSTGGSSDYVKGKLYKKDGKTWRYLGVDSGGQHKWEGYEVKVPDMKKVKTQSNTDYKSTGSRKGKVKKKRVKKGGY
jgi:hypothetical protein